MRRILVMLVVAAAVLAGAWAVFGRGDESLLGGHGTSAEARTGADSGRKAATHDGEKASEAEGDENIDSAAARQPAVADDDPEADRGIMGVNDAIVTTGTTNKTNAELAAEAQARDAAAAKQAAEAKASAIAKAQKEAAEKKAAAAAAGVTAAVNRLGEPVNPADDTGTTLVSSDWTTDRIAKRFANRGKDVPDVVLTDLSGKVMVFQYKTGVAAARVVLHTFVPERAVRGSTVVPLVTDLETDENGLFSAKVPVARYAAPDYPALTISVIPKATQTIMHGGGKWLPEWDTDPRYHILREGEFAVCGLPAQTIVPGSKTSLGIFWAPQHSYNLSCETSPAGLASGQKFIFTGQADPTRWASDTLEETLKFFPTFSPAASGVSSRWLAPMERDRTHYVSVRMADGRLAMGEAKSYVPEKGFKVLPEDVASPVDSSYRYARVTVEPPGERFIDGEVLDAEGAGVENAVVIAKGKRRTAQTTTSRGGKFRLEGIPEEVTIIEATHESWITVAASVPKMLDSGDHTIKFTTPRPDFQLVVRDSDNRQPVQTIRLTTRNAEVVWRLAADNSVVSTVSKKNATEERTSPNGVFRITGEFAVDQLTIVAVGFRPLIIKAKDIPKVAKGAVTAEMIATRDLKIVPSAYSACENLKEGEWQKTWIPVSDSAGTGNIWTPWNNMWAEYSVNFDQGLPPPAPGDEPVALPFDLVLGCKNENGLVDNSYQFHVEVRIDGEFKGLVRVQADALNERTGTIKLGKLTGTHTVRLKWINDKWIPNQLDANIRIMSIRFIETQ